MSILTTYGVQAIARLEAWSLALLTLFLVLCTAVILTIWRQPQNQQKVAFMVCEIVIRNPNYYIYTSSVCFLCLIFLSKNNQWTRLSKFFDEFLLVTVHELSYSPSQKLEDTYVHAYIHIYSQ